MSRTFKLAAIVILALASSWAILTVGTLAHISALNLPPYARLVSESQFAVVYAEPMIDGTTRETSLIKYSNAVYNQRIINDGHTVEDRTFDTQSRELEFIVHYSRNATTEWREYYSDGRLDYREYPEYDSLGMEISSRIYKPKDGKLTFSHVGKRIDLTGYNVYSKFFANTY
jgi:hypothetical protein